MKRQISEKQLKRFKVLDKFVKDFKRFPTHEIIGELFGISPGGTTFELVEKYKESKNGKCPLCQK